VREHRSCTLDLLTQPVRRDEKTRRKDERCENQTTILTCQLSSSRAVLSAIRLRDTQVFGKQDPYVVLRCGESKANQQRTKVCKDGGTAPTWNERFTFTLTNDETEIDVRIWNSNTLKSDTQIGSAKIELDKVFKEEYDDVEVLVYDWKGRQAGVLNIVLTFTASRAPVAAPAPVSLQQQQQQQQQPQQQFILQQQRHAQQTMQYHQPGVTAGGYHPNVTVVQVPQQAPAQHAPQYVPKPIGQYHETNAHGGYMPPPPGWAPPAQHNVPDDDGWGV